MIFFFKVFKNFFGDQNRLPISFNPECNLERGFIDSLYIDSTGWGFRLQLRCSESIESPKIVRSFVIPSSSNQADLSCHALFKLIGKLVYASTDYYFFWKY